MKKKKGEMTSKMLVTIILLVAAFAILLFMYYQLFWEGRVDREVCHESVVLRGTLPDAFGISDAAPLKCKTNKICVRGKKLFGGGECEEFSNADFVTNAEVDDISQVERLIANEIVDCWAMMGEGKISVFSQYVAKTYGFGSVYPSCVICSRIAFDEETLEEKRVDFKDVDVWRYMATHKIPSSEKSYSEYLAGEGGKMSVEDLFGLETVNEEEIRNAIDSGTSESKEVAVLFMQISAPSHGDALGNLVEAVFGVGVATAPVSIPAAKYVGKLCLKGGWVSIGCAAVGALAIGGQQLNVFYNKGISSDYCGDISVGGEEREGCSVVRTVNYDVEEIKQYCSIIESIP